MNTKICLIIFVSAFGLLIVSAIIGNILESNGTLRTLGSKGTTAMNDILFCAVLCSGFFDSAAGFTVFHFCADKNRQWRVLPDKMASGT